MDYIKVGLGALAPVATAYPIAKLATSMSKAKSTAAADILAAQKKKEMVVLGSHVALALAAFAGSELMKDNFVVREVLEGVALGEGAAALYVGVWATVYAPSKPAPFMATIGADPNKGMLRSGIDGVAGLLSAGALTNTFPSMTG